MVLDSEAISRWLRDDSEFAAWLEGAQRERQRVVTTPMVLLEATYAKTDPRRLDWVTSVVAVEPVTRDTVRAAAALLIAAGLHGHGHAIDATVAELANRQPRPVTVLTSDPDDLRRLCATDVVVHALT